MRLCASNNELAVAIPFAIAKWPNLSLVAEIRWEYHQSFAQPGFEISRRTKKRVISSHFLLISCVWGEKGQEKTRAQPLVRV